MALVLYTSYMADSSYFGCALCSDGFLKDASEIEWHYNENDKLPIAPVTHAGSSTSTTKIHLFFANHPTLAEMVEMVAGSHHSV